MIRIKELMMIYYRIAQIKKKAKKGNLKDGMKLRMNIKIIEKLVRNHHKKR